MKKKATKLTALITSALFLLCSCQETLPPSETIKNGNFGGIQFETSESVQTAAPIPEYEIVSRSSTEETEIIQEESGISDTAVSDTTTVKETTASSATTETTTSETTASVSATTPETTVQTTTTEKTTIQTTTKETTTTTEATTAETTTALPETEAEPVVSAPSGEVHGVWISYLEVSTLLKGKSEADFRTAVKKIYSNCVSLGINTV